MFQTPNPAWPPPSLFLPVLPERIKDFSTKNWCQIAGSGPVPWRQAPSLFTSSAAQSDFQPRMPFDVDIPSGIDRLIGSERLSASSLEKKKVEDSSERLMNGSLKLGASEILENGINSGEQASPSINVPQKSSFLKIDTSTSHFGLGVSSSSLNESNDQTKVSGCHAPRPTPPPLIGKQFCGHNGVDSSGETQIRNGRPRSDARSRNQLLPRYWPRITDQELQQISGKYPIVLCGGVLEFLLYVYQMLLAYFPPISQPEGLPLKVQDLKGKEWIFQFRFWPNNNSRMYVLEGVTPCIQSMQLQAGDTGNFPTLLEKQSFGRFYPFALVEWFPSVLFGVMLLVTFSRIEPEGKLVMGFRKASITPSSNQGNETANASNGISTNGDVSAKKIKAGEVLSTHQLKGNLVSPGFSSIDQANSADQASPLSKDDKSGYKAKEVLGAKSSFRNKRKNSILGSKSKRLRIEKEDLIELKLTWEQAQGLLRPPLNSVPSVVVIEGFEVEEYEKISSGLNVKTVLSGAKFPLMLFFLQDGPVPKTHGIPKVAQELTAEQLEDLIPSSNRAASKKMKVAKQDPDSVEALEGLDALANLAIQEEGEALPASSSQATTKHPRHRPGCTCIVCIQPPSGKGPKHKQTCTCNVCLTVKRRFRTLMMRREQKQSEKDAETARQKSQQHPLLPETLLDDNNGGSISPKQKIPSSEDPDDDLSRMRPSLPTFKGQIDLNIQPERDEELSPGSDSGSMMRLVQDATERYLRQQRLTNPNRNSSGNQLQLGGIGIGGNLRNNVSVAIGSSSHQEAEAECSVPLNSNALGSTSAAER
ncbi:hypothetical protein TEA_001823 [Camellia sinensis var. sinensis]|uniref:HSI2-like 1 n=1 Tax=Camellia sinensis var. sinensis TaxID=542762 RepID=A0A4S4EU61_CAMSN|nr:hypothetical protein TEA_001823 [Camellia sinensis var. sinensis]